MRMSTHMLLNVVIIVQIVSGAENVLNSQLCMFLFFILFLCLHDSGVEDVLGSLISKEVLCRKLDVHCTTIEQYFVEIILP